MLNEFCHSLLTEPQRQTLTSDCFGWGIQLWVFTRTINMLANMTKKKSVLQWKYFSIHTYDSDLFLGMYLSFWQPNILGTTALMWCNIHSSMQIQYPLLGLGCLLLVVFSGMRCSVHVAASLWSPEGLTVSAGCILSHSGIKKAFFF